VHVHNVDVFCNTIWDALASQALANWRQEVQETGTLESESRGKLANYRQFKFFPKIEPYVRLNLPVTVRRVVAGLRAGCLPLQIELGRFTQPKTPLDQRICLICDQETETEEHFLVCCKPLEESRKCLLDTVTKDL